MTDVVQRENRKCRMCLALALGVTSFSVSVFGAVTFEDFGIVNGVPIFKVSGLKTETLVVQRKTAGEVDWSDGSCRKISGNYYAFGSEEEKLIDDGSEGSDAAVTFRVSADGWQSSTEFSYLPRKTLIGTLLQGGSAHWDYTVHANAVDGDPSTYYEPKTATWPNKGYYVGYSYANKKSITGVRVVPRSGWVDRLNGCEVEVADNSTFANAQVLCTISGVDSVSIYEFEAAEPVIGNYVRITCGGRTEIFNVAEFEVVGDDLPVVFTTAGIINGRAMMCSQYEVGGQTLEAEWRYGVQDGFSVCPVKKLVTVGQCKYYGLGTDGEKAWGVVVCRVRISGATEWTELSWSTSDVLTGSTISGGSWKTAQPPSYAYDGKEGTYCEPNASKGMMTDPSSWMGLDLGSSRLVSGCRVMPRPTFAARAVGRYVEVSDSPDFSNATIAGLTPEALDYRISEATFDVPVRGRYVRIRNSDEQTAADVINFAELTFFTTEELPPVTVTPCDMANAHAVVSWNPIEAIKPLVGVYGAPAVGGPWTLLQSVPYDAACWTNESDQVGVKMYYAIDGLSDSTGSDGLSNPVAYTRFSRIDARDPSTGSLTGGMSAIWGRNVPWTLAPNLAFDGDVSTYPDGKEGGAKTHGEVALGIDMAQDYIVRALRCYPRSGADWAPKRLGSNYLFGVPDGQDLLTSSTKVNANMTEDSTRIAWREMTTGFVEVPIRQFFLQGNTDFYGNVTELEVYGYPASALLTGLTAPETITALPRANGVFVTWQPCLAATAYAVERRAVGGDWTNVYEGTAASCLDTTAEIGMSYEYRVKAIGGASIAYSGTAAIGFSSEAVPISPEWAEAFALGVGVSGGVSVGQDGTIAIHGANGEIDRYGEKGYWLRRTVTDGTTASCTVTADAADSINGETIYLTVRAGEGEGEPFAAIGFRVMKSYDGRLFGSFGVRSRKTANGVVEENVAWTTPASDLLSAQLRIRQSAGHVFCWYRKVDAEKWILLADVVFSDQTFGPKAEGGLIATTPCGAETVSESQWLVSDYLSVPRRGLILMVQ